MRSDREGFYQQIATHKVATQSLNVAQVVDKVIEQCGLSTISGEQK
jgi:hypothetical protein